MIPTPEFYDLPNDYALAKEYLFYKIYDKQPYLDARDQCQSDGASLFLPESEDENKFMISLIPGEDIWIGADDINNEGDFVSLDNKPLTWTKWAPNEPNNEAGNEDAAHIIGSRSDMDVVGYWNDKSIARSSKFVCTLNI